MPRRFGVEEEFLVVEGATSAAAPAGSRIARRAELNGHEADLEFKQEQIEIASAPVTSSSELVADLKHRRAAVVAAAEQEDCRIVALGTYPLPIDPLATVSERFDRMEADFGVTATDQLTCGQHVHVEVASREEGVDVLNRIAPWLSVLTALSVNSPFWQGKETGFGSFRTVRWGMWPTTVPFQGFSSLEEYDGLIADLVESGVAYDEAMVYADARLSAKYPTVEIRVTDVSTDVEDAVLLGVLCRALVETAVRDGVQGVPIPQVRSELLRAASFQAARCGVTGALMDAVARRARPARAVVDALVDHVRGVLTETDDLDLVQDGLARVFAGGRGAVRQREIRKRGGFDAVVEDAVLRSMP